jgi:hypothetical protein
MTLPLEVSKHLFDISLFILLALDNGDASNEFDALFPDFDYWETRTGVISHGGINYEGAPKINPSDSIRSIWLLGYPDIATTAKRYLRNLGVQV